MAKKVVAPKKPASQPAPQTPKPKVDLVALARKARELREQHAKQSEPVPKEAKVVRYMVQFDNDRVDIAEGAHADLIYRYLLECEQLVAQQGLARYNGPKLKRISLEELRTILNGPPTVV